jgi:hypothetical protein
MYVAEAEAHKAGFAGEALRAHRRRRLQPIADDFAKWLAAIAPTLLPSDPLTTAVGYYRKHWDALTRFIDDPAVPIDNSPTEREFQNFAKLRLNMLFAAAPRAPTAPTCCSASSPRVAPSASYLAWVFERLGTHREAFGLALNALTPAAFKGARG